MPKQSTVKKVKVRKITAWGKVLMNEKSSLFGELLFPIFLGKRYEPGYKTVKLTISYRLPQKTKRVRK